MDFLVTIAFIFAIIAYMGIKIVPQQKAWVVETLGKYDRVLQPGLNFLFPFVQRIAYKHSLKEEAVAISLHLRLMAFYMYALLMLKPHLTVLMIRFMPCRNWHKLPCVQKSAKLSLIKPSKSGKV
jgi:hypothetical protein